MTDTSDIVLNVADSDATPAAAASSGAAEAVDQSILASLFSSCEQGTSAAADDVINLLSANLHNLDLNQLTNSIGETPVHVAASSGNLDIIQLLQTKGASLILANRAGETPLHYAARNGHLPVVSYLQEQGVDLNKRNEVGETAVHVATRQGHVKLVESLILAGADANLQTSRGYTALHLACQNKNVAIALMLLYLGCRTDVTDQLDEMAMHDACREGLLPVVQTMCSQGCPVDKENKSGLTPLHLAAKTGNVEVVRCLLLSGADIDKYNKDGVRAEDIALAQGHTDVSDLLSRLSASITSDRREPFVRQLLPTKQGISRIKVKIFGSGGVGKTTLIESLKCGYFRSFFRRAYTGYESARLLKASTDDSKPSRPSLQVPYECYTRGIDVQQVAISGVGDVSVWEFSGYEPYYSYYDFFVGDPSCIHVVVFSVKDELHVRKAQIYFWLNFIRSRIPPSEPIGYSGANLWAPHVILVATHASDGICAKDANGEYIMEGWSYIEPEIRKTFEADLIIIPRLFVLDAQQAMSTEIKNMRTALGKTKTFLSQYLGNTLGFLEPTIAEIPAWTRMLAGFPVVQWTSFVEYIRSRVNLLATEDHIRELVGQLQMAGEIVYMAVADKEDLVVLNPKWLSTEVLGKLFSFEHISVAPENGRLPPDEIRILFPQLDLPDLKKLFEALDLCIECKSNGGETEYDFPSLNSLQAPSTIWNDFQSENAVCGGVRISCPTAFGDQLLHIFPRVVLMLHRSLALRPGAVTLQQWSTTCKLVGANMSTVVMMSHDKQEIDIQCCGMDDQLSSFFRFAEYLYSLILKTVDHCCPGVYLKRHLISPADLKAKCSPPRAYSTKEILLAQLEDKAEVQLDEQTSERLVDLIAFGSDEIYSTVTLGINLHVTQLSMYTRCQLASVLDPVHPAGNDWKALAKAIDVIDKLPALDKPDSTPVSKTDVVLAIWSYKPTSTVRVLVEKLKEIERQDAVDVLLSEIPAFFCASPEDETAEG